MSGHLMLYVAELLGWDITDLAQKGSTQYMDLPFL